LAKLVVFEKAHPQDYFDRICKLGKGAFGEVFKVIKKTDQEAYALKTIIPRGQVTIETVVNEIGLMKMCQDDENILNCYEMYQDKNKYFIIVEIMSYPLNDVIEKF
jgi:NIMA (never in mitosis gene a)-related kinase 1/4/5